MTAAIRWRCARSTDGSRNVGDHLRYDNFALTPALTVAYGGDLLALRLPGEPQPDQPASRADAVARQDPLTGCACRSTRCAPGAEEFLPPATAGIWLPPQRTFSSLERGRRVQGRANALSAASASSATSAPRPRPYRPSGSRSTISWSPSLAQMCRGQPTAKVGPLPGRQRRRCRRRRLQRRIPRRHRQPCSRLGRILGGPRRNPHDRRLHYLMLLAPVGGTARPRAPCRTVDRAIETEVPETATRVDGAVSTQQRVRARPAAAPIAKPGHRRPLRCAGPAVAAVHEFQQRPLGDAARGPQLLPREPPATSRSTTNSRSSGRRNGWSAA